MARPTIGDCVNLIAHEDAEGAFVGQTLRAWVVVDVSRTQRAHFLLPGLPRLPQQYPDIRLHFSERTTAGHDRQGLTAIPKGR